MFGNEATLLSIWVLNAGEGDSIVLRFPDESWAVVDSNVPPGSKEPPALRLLREKRVRNLSFVCLTHPHADHYSGLAEILGCYEGRIGGLWMFCIDSAHVRKFLIAQHQKSSTTPGRLKQYLELQTIFQVFQKMGKKGLTYQLVGGLRLPSCGDVTIDCLSPLSRDINEYQNQLARCTEPQHYTAQENLLSSVLRLRYGLCTILLSSDAPTKSWPRVWKETVKRRESFVANAVKVSHHGSREGHHEEIWKKMLAPQQTHAAISAGVGHGHPDPSVLQSLFSLGVRLHCTNFPEYCSSRRPLDLSKFEGIPEPAVVRLFMLDESSKAPLSPCNGDIRFDFDPAGTCTVRHQFEGFCPMHLQPT